MVEKISAFSVVCLRDVNRAGRSVHAATRSVFSAAIFVFGFWVSRDSYLWIYLRLLKDVFGGNDCVVRGAWVSVVDSRCPATVVERSAEDWCR